MLNSTPRRVAEEREKKETVQGYRGRAHESTAICQNIVRLSRTRWDTESTDTEAEWNSRRMGGREARCGRRNMIQRKIATARSFSTSTMLFHNLAPSQRSLVGVDIMHIVYVFLCLFQPLSRVGSSLLPFLSIHFINSIKVTIDVT